MATITKSLNVVYVIIYQRTAATTVANAEQGWMKMKISVEFANGYRWIADIKQIAVDDSVACALDSVHNVVHGQWEWEEGVHVYGVDSKNQHGSVRCSACGNCSPHSTNYCPRCGADMRPEYGAEMGTDDG